MDLRTVIQHVIAQRTELEDLGAMNLAYDWGGERRTFGKRPSYGRIDPDLNPRVVDDVATVCNVGRDDARAILDVWNAFAFGYDEGYAHGAGENDPVTDADLSQYDVWLRSDGSGEVIFSHPYERDPDAGDDEPFCAVCGETSDPDGADQHSPRSYTKEA